MTGWLAGLGPVGLFLLSLAHDVFSPVPPEVLFVPLGLAAPHAAFWLALLMTAGSLAGGLIGYGVGFLAGRPVLARWFGPERLARAEQLLTRYDALAIVAATFTPLPFKLITIPAGVMRVGLGRFLLVAAAARGLRFLAEAAVLYWLGPSLVHWIFSHLGVIFVALLAGAAVTWYLWRRRGLPAS